MKCSVLLLTALLWTPLYANPKPDGTVRQTASPWTGRADEFEYPGREKTLKLPQVMGDMGIKAGTRVADIGAGGGWLTVRLAMQVGPTGTVYAEEILPKYTAYIDRRAKLMKLNNVKTILGTTTDPKLPAGALDAVVILNAYHEFDQPLAMLKAIRAGLKPGGRLGIIERDDEPLRQEAREAYAKTGKVLRRIDEKPGNTLYTDDHRLAREIVEREAGQMGFRKLSERELGGDIYIVVFTR